MLQDKNRVCLLTAGILGVALLFCLVALKGVLSYNQDQNEGKYQSLAPDLSEEEPLKYINEDFTVDEEFHTNLPIVILSIDGEISEYKSFSDGIETVNREVEPYETGSISIIAQNEGDNYLTDEPVSASKIKIKKRGHTSFSYDKPQYLIKTVGEDGKNSDKDFFGLGADSSWVLNGSMADKSMIRNYISYQISSEIGGNNMAPDSRYCEVLIKNGEQYEYRGVYMLIEAITRGESRVNIDKYKQKNAYSSYLVRRDRFTNFDIMLDTYGRLNGFAEQWIGLKYPSASKITEDSISYIQNDFSKIEKVIYSDNESLFRIYDKYINVDSFVDYFLINEYFGNYDAGEHSTYMYKNSGELLNIGPVWDFDQAMNNYYAEEMDSGTLALQTKPFYDRLIYDKHFIDKLKKRYSVLQNNQLSEEHVFAVIDETVNYLKSARSREWYRWAADYKDNSFANIHNYYLQDYMIDGIIINRFNDNYEQEIYNIKNYIHHHKLAIQDELTKMVKSATIDSSLHSENGLFLLITMVLLFVPSYFINKRG